MRLISRKFCMHILTYVFNWLYFTQCLTSFSSQSSALSLCTVFHFISSNIDEVLSINASANIYVFGDFIIRTDLPILVELIYVVNSVISNDLAQMVNFPTRIPYCDSQSCSFEYISSDACNCTMGSSFSVLTDLIIFYYQTAIKYTIHF